MPPGSDYRYKSRSYRLDQLDDAADGAQRISRSEENGYCRVHLIAREFPDFDYQSEGDDRGARLVMTMTDQAVQELQDYAINQNLTRLRALKVHLHDLHRLTGRYGNGGSCAHWIFLFA